MKKRGGGGIGNGLDIAAEVGQASTYVYIHGRVLNLTYGKLYIHAMYIFICIGTMVNIFILDTNPARAARFHADQHVNKMLIEAGQILCTALRVNGFDDVPYDAFGTHHPVVQWVAESSRHWHWTFQLAEALYNEHVDRGGNRDHQTWSKIKSLRHRGYDLPDHGWSRPAQAFNNFDHLRHVDPVIGYRDYYAAAKRYLRGKHATWTSGMPQWWPEHLERVDDEIPRLCP